MNLLWKRVQEWIKARMAFLVIVAGLYFLFMVVLVLLWGNRTPLGKVVVPWDWIWLATVVGYTLASITGTGLSERASKFLFAKLPIGMEIPPQTLTLVPFGLFTLERLSVEVQELELPGESEQIWSGQDKEGRELILGLKEDGSPAPLPKKMGENGEVRDLPWVQPVRATLDDMNPSVCKDPIAIVSNLPDMPKFQIAPLTLDEDGKAPEEEPEDPASKRVTVEVRGTLLWRPRVLPNFWRSFETFDKAKEVLRKITISEMTSALQVGNLARMLANQELLGLYIATKIRERVDHQVIYTKDGQIYHNHPKGKTPEPPDPDDCRRGVEIVGFLLRPPDLSHRLNTKIQEIIEGKAEAGAMRRRAEGTKEKLRLEGEGERHRLEQIAEGERAQERGKIIGRKEGYAALKEIGMTSTEILAADTARQIAENVTSLFVSDQAPLSGVLGALATGRKSLELPPAPSPPPPTNPPN